MKSLLLAGLIAGIFNGIVWAIRLMIWHDEVPCAVSKLRWAIALPLAFLIILGEVMAGLDPSSVSTLNAASAFFIAEALRAPKKPKEEKPSP